MTQIPIPSTHVGAQFIAPTSTDASDAPDSASTTPKNTLAPTDAAPDAAPAPTTPAKLYALQLKLRPLEYGTLMPFSGELVHAAWLDWIRSGSPDVSAALHDGNQRRLFTCSSLQFPIPPYRMRQAERDNVHLPVEPAKTYTVRLTFLLGDLFPLFYDALMRYNMVEIGVKRPPFMQIGKRTFLLEEVIADQESGTGWTGFTTFAGLVERAKAAKLERDHLLKLEFASLTTFSRIGAKERGYGSHYAVLPLPQYIFPGLARRWQELAPPELAHYVQPERVEAYVREDGVIIGDYDLRPHWVTFTKHRQRGFAGMCMYVLRGEDEPVTPDAPLTIRQQFILLTQLAFYTGVGYKVAQGMGQTRVIERKGASNGDNG